MNVENVHSDVSSSPKKLLFSIAGAVSILLVSNCSSHSHPAKIVPIGHMSLPYRPLSELGKNPSFSLDSPAQKQLNQIHTTLFSSAKNLEDDEFVDDYGNVFTRDQLESSNK